MPLSRRFVLGQLVSAAVGSTMLASGARGQKVTPPTPAPLGLGFSLYGFPGRPLVEGLEVCREAGYDSVEFPLMPGWGGEPRGLDASARGELRRRLTDSGMKLPALMENLPALVDAPTFLVHQERLRRAITLAQDLVPEAPPLIETIVGGKPAEWEQMRELLRDRVATMANLAQQAGGVLAIKGHISSALHEPAGVRWLLDQVNSPALRLAFDYSHFVGRGFPLDATLLLLARDISFVHVKDRSRTPDRIEFLLPGEGTIDHAELVGRLARAGYQGHVVVEVSAQIHQRPGYEPRRAAQTCYDHLVTAWRRAGIGRPERVASPPS